MYRYPDGTMRVNPPVKVEYLGYVRKFADLTCEQRDEIGYNEAVPVTREPFTTYVTEWVKGEDLIYREETTSAVVDEAAKAAHEAETIRDERDGLIAASDAKVLQLERQIRLATAAGEDTTTLTATLAQWDRYREELCDVPEQAGFPGAVEWPGVPG